MKIIFAGTPDFAVAPLKKIQENGFEIVGVITQIDKPQGRKGILTPPPVKTAAMEMGIPVLQPEKIRDFVNSAEHIEFGFHGLLHDLFYEGKNICGQEFAWPENMVKGLDRQPQFRV